MLVDHMTAETLRISFPIDQLAISSTMVQGNTKGLKKGANASGGRKNLGITKKGKRAVAPKEKDRVRHAAVQKVSEMCVDGMPLDPSGNDEQYDASVSAWTAPPAGHSQARQS